MFFFEIQFIAPFFAGIFSLAVGLFTFFQNRKGATHQYFLMTTIAVAAWSFMVGVFHHPWSTANSLWNLHWLAGFFLAPTVLLTLINFPESRLVVPKAVRVAIWGGTIALALSFALWPRLFIQYYVFSPQEIPKVIVGPLSFLLEFYFAVYFLFALLFFVKTLAQTSGLIYAQVIGGLLGFIVGTAGGFATNLILPIHFGVELIWLGPLFTVIGITSFSYMLFGVHGARTRFFPIVTLACTILLALAFQMITSRQVGLFIFHGALFVGTLLLALFLLREVLIESADVKRFQTLSRKLARTNEELQRADRIKSEFLSIASHHLRTPLTHIKWALDGFMKGEYGGISSEQTKLLESLLANNERLVGFVDALFDTSRIETGKMTLEKEQVSLESLIREAVGDLHSRAVDYYRVEIIVRPPKTFIPMLMVDRELMRRAFENVIENAITYNHPGGKVYIEWNGKDDMAEIEVRDTGIGILSDDLSRIGEKFFRTSHAKHYVAEGTGVGVFIAKHVLLLHGGSLEIRSEKDRGTTVQIRLPKTAGG